MKQAKQIKQPISLHAIVLPTFFHTLDEKTPQSQTDKWPTFNFSPFDCCLTVILSLCKRAYSENSYVVLYLVFLRFVSSDFALER